MPSRLEQDDRRLQRQAGNSRHVHRDESYVISLGSAEKHLTAQVSFSVNRKFLWIWVYEKTSDGTLFLNVRLDRPLEDPHFHRVGQISANRWNHHVVVKTMEAAQSDWLRDLIRAGHEFAAR